MNIELLNVRIFITKNEVTVDAIGNHKASWVPYYSCYATVSAEAGKEDTDAGMIETIRRSILLSGGARRLPP